MAALLIKPQALIFAPLPILWFADRILRRERHAVADLLLFTGTAIVTFCLGIFPFAVNDHQTKNAELLVNRGAAAMIPERDLTGESLSGVIRRLAQDPGKIEEMDKLMNMAIGRGAQAGSASIGAAANQLGAISMTPTYDPTTAAILGAGALGGSIYQGYQNRAPGGTPAQINLTSFNAV